MALIDDLRKIAERVKAQRFRMTNEAVTCTVSVEPFLRALGHVTEDPRQVFPQYDADPKWSGGKTVDYAILCGDAPVFLVEAKSATVNLGATQWEQLYQYFNATDARFGILTNGLAYQFYADRKKRNIMDREPFATIDLLELEEAGIAQLDAFQRSCFPHADRTDDNPPMPSPAPDSFEYPIYAHLDGQRIVAQLVVDQVMNWHKQYILVRFEGNLFAHKEAQRKAVQSVTPGRKSSVGAWTFWRFEHPVSGGDLPISVICLDVQSGGPLRKQLWEGIQDEPPANDKVPVPVFDIAKVFEATLFLDEHSPLWANECVRFRNKCWTPKQAANAARPGVQAPGISFWHFKHPDTKQLVAIKELEENAHELRMQLMASHRK